jgi:hypothetical protein
MSDLLKYSVEELQDYYYDFYKEVYGYRPRFMLELDSWTDREYLISAITQIHDHLDRVKETFAGREELRQQGWIVEETDPELARQAKWLADERQREYAEWDKKYNGDLV